MSFIWEIQRAKSHRDTLHSSNQRDTICMSWYWIALFYTLLFSPQKCAGMGNCKTHHDFCFRAIFVSVFVFRYNISTLIWSCALCSLSNPVQNINPSPNATLSPVVQVTCVHMCECVRYLPHLCIHAKRYAWVRTTRALCCRRQMFIQLILGTNSYDTVAASLTLCSDSSMLNGEGGHRSSSCFHNLPELHLIGKVGPLWTVHFVLMKGIVLW